LRPRDVLESSIALSGSYGEAACSARQVRRNASSGASSQSRKPPLTRFNVCDGSSPKCSRYWAADVLVGQLTY
jgi:hypothetical protein